MIDFAKEELLSLTDAARRLPHRRAGRPTHVATLFRWAKRGVRGVRLETVRIGGCVCTSSEAITRFIERLSSGNASGQPQRTVAEARRSHIQAEKELALAGI